ncbi:dual specificity protein phosphatase family protein [Halapricum salinum]|uniref:Phosphatase n=1 Tax=Halapricum salinum TaxID=1457250 RepID=A0A4D6HCU7_9EURY|nr:dual specificity protein phosphatase [Halapricum salinum]QCC51904.1 phosphatase [Halapricum salinum]
MDEDSAGGERRSTGLPFWFGEDKPVVRRIGERDLYLGNWQAADPERSDQAFDHVVSATFREYPRTTHHHPMADGPETDWETFAAAVDDARSCYRAEGSLLVHCTAGVSRSSSILGTLLAVEEGLALEAALDLVREARPCATPHPALHSLAVLYVAAEA